MKVMPVEPNPNSHTAKEHMSNLESKLIALLCEYESVLNPGEIKACVQTLNFYSRLIERAEDDS